MTADTAERHLNLQWKNFQSCFQISVNSLRDDTCFQDVTLSCSGQLLHANRLVLAACSTHFRQLFETIPAQQHAVLVLPTVDADVMRAVLDFIYCGEVCVRQSLLGGFLQFADAFCIKGLSGSSRVPRGAAAASTKSQQRAGAGGESRPAGEARPPAAKRRHCSASIEEQLARADQVTFVANFDGGVSAGADTAAGAMPQHPQENDGEEVADCDGEDGAAAAAGGGGGGDDGGDGGDGAEHSLVSPSMCEDDREEQEVEDSSSAAAGAGGGGGGMMARKSSAGRRWSSVWDYYEVSGADDSQLVCKLCDKVFRNMAGDPGHSSSNYWKHLRRIHHIR